MFLCMWCIESLHFYILYIFTHICCFPWRVLCHVEVKYVYHGFRLCLPKCVASIFIFFICMVWPFYIYIYSRTIAARQPMLFVDWNRLKITLIVLHCIVSYRIASHRIASYSIVSYIVLYCIVLYCIVWTMPFWDAKLETFASLHIVWWFLHICPERGIACKLK